MAIYTVSKILILYKDKLIYVYQISRIFPSMCSKLPIIFLLQFSIWFYIWNVLYNVFHKKTKLYNVNNKIQINNFLLKMFQLKDISIFNIRYMYIT